MWTTSLENRGQEGGEAYRRAGAFILPLRAQNYATFVPGKKSERTVFTMAKFTIPDGKCLVVELNEKNGGRHQSFVIEKRGFGTCQYHQRTSSALTMR
ncbi:conjugative transposon TraN protein, partial [human gut metagenome]